MIRRALFAVATIALAALAVDLFACTSKWECDGKCYSEPDCKGIVIGCPPPGTGMAADAGTIELDELNLEPDAGDNDSGGY